MGQVQVLGDDLQTVLAMHHPDDGVSPRSRRTTSWVAASVKTPAGECSMRMSREVSTVNR